MNKIIKEKLSHTRSTGASKTGMSRGQLFRIWFIQQETSEIDLKDNELEPSSQPGAVRGTSRCGRHSLSMVSKECGEYCFREGGSTCWYCITSSPSFLYKDLKIGYAIIVVGSSSACWKRNLELLISYCINSTWSSY
ncbi:unnamed protein product [Allacma fusca]|uniref:Uncharacterized protein n=1 Tax=Allacma fusca TaxID=39272 RepID=A0A8J2L1W7_9HEXA|nr:unnamed protein product [Allacma fusca]